MIQLTYCGSYTALTGYGGYRHHHTWSQLEVVERGVYAVLGKDGELMLRAGDAVLIPPGVDHGWGYARNAHVLTFRYTHDQPDDALSDGDSVVVKSLRDDPWLATLPRRACLAWRSENHHIRESSQLLFQALIQTLVANATEKPASNLQAEWTQLIEDLHDIQQPPLEIEEMARRIYLSPSHFRRIFAGHTGVAPGRFQREARLRRAAELLQFTDVSASQVAEQLGYSDLASFSKAFMKQHGYRPSKVRQ